MNAAALAQLIRMFASPLGVMVLVWILEPEAIGLAVMTMVFVILARIAGSRNHDRENYPIRGCALKRTVRMAAMTAMLLDISNIVYPRHSLERRRA